MSIWDRLKNYRSRGPQASPVIEALPLGIVESQLCSELDKELAAVGFSGIGKRRWGKELAPEIYAVIELETLKGAFTAGWGVSLPFVPHLTKDFRVAWHRTLKTARFDLSYHPRDYAEERSEWVVSQLATREELATEVPKFASDVVQNARDFFSPLTSVQALPAAFEAKRDRPFVQFGLKNYPQELLAFAFVLARCGRKADAGDQLRAFWARVREFDDGANVPQETEAEIASLVSKAMP